MKTLKVCLQNISLKIKIQLISLFCIVFIFIVSSIGIYFISKSFENSLYHSASLALSYSARNIEDYLNQTDNLANTIFADSLIQKQLPLFKNAENRTEKDSHKAVIYNQLVNYLMSGEINAHIRYIAIFPDENNVCSTYSLESSRLTPDIRRSLIRSARKADGKTQWITDYCQENGVFLVKELREIKNLSFRSLGVLVINVDLDCLISSTNVTLKDYDELSCVLIRDGEVFYHNDTISDRNAQYLDDHLKNDYGIFSLDEQKVFAVKGRIPDYQWHYISTVSYDSVAKTVFITRNACFLAILLSIVFAFFTSSRLSATLTSHIRLLIQKMNRVGNGNYTLEENDLNYTERKDEIGQLHNNFNAMTIKLDNLIHENYVNELLKKDAQLKALESQMDPHFLYNTLDSIHWRAQNIGAEDISQIITALGNLLRISLNKTNVPFTIQEESSLLDNYMVIQKLRYPQRLEYSIEIPDDCRNLQIPKFTIQPLLENAIRYGLEEISEVCYISVKMYINSGALMIEVKNSGSAFEENLLDNLFSGKTQPHGFGIGLINIHQRLQIAFGEEYGLTLSNIEDEETGDIYAVVHVRLPMIPLQKGCLPC